MIDDVADKKTQVINQQRRGFVKQRAAVLAAAGLLNPIAGIAAPSHNYGIEGQLAPDLDLDYWIDGKGKRTRFDRESTKGK